MSDEPTSKSNPGRLRTIVDRVAASPVQRFAEPGATRVQPATWTGRRGIEPSAPKIALARTATEMPADSTLAPIQRMDEDSSSDWEEEKSEAPPGFMTPSEYRDEIGGSDHWDLEGKVWVSKIGGWPALWWKDPVRVERIKLTGSRARDILAAGGSEGSGLTWHHCADFASGQCTMQLVPTDEHDSWGHKGGAGQAYASDQVKYGGYKREH